ncbi:hypothetical protein CQW23_16669 [Capsicum baccatum]|uniref:Cytochrome n=1 Tax=Capsicum baccatum TaxID=33114 RepID=A0A2G2WBL5_CAPBA|nr:hypothetical protein CQW23_16669 [Capsicum baccatum]
MDIAVLIALAVCFPIAFWCLKLLYFVWWRPKTVENELRQQGIYGRPYRFLFGNLKEMIEMNKIAKSKPMPLHHDYTPRLNPLFYELATTYKKLYLFWLGPIPRVTILDPKLIKEVLSNKSGEFRKPKISAFLKLFVTGLGTYDGEKWAKHRRILNPAFHMEKLKLMLGAFAHCTEDMISRWDKQTGSTGSCELDISQEFHSLTGDMLSKAAFGSNFEEGKLVFSLLREQCELIFTAKLAINVFPWLRFVPTKTNRRRLYIYYTVRNSLKGIIEKREKEVQSGKAHNDDLLGLLMKSNQEEQQGDKNSSKGMGTEDVIEECNSFYFAGQETTATLLTWTAIVLTMHPDWQEKARKEVREIIGKDEPKFDQLNQLKIVTMILNEVLRLYPSGSLVRETNKKTKLGEYTIPSGAQLLVPLQTIHRNTEAWGEDALIFNPERFSEGVSKAAKDLMYFPFGWGSRICLGMNFAMIQVKLVLAKILQYYSFELSPSYAHGPTMPALVLQPQYGAPIIVRKLS